MASGRVVRASRHRHRAAIRQGEKVRNVPGKYSFPTSPSRSRQVNGVMSGAVRVRRRIERLSVDSRVSGSSVRLIYIIHE